MTDWFAWAQEVFGDRYLVWHDGPDFTVLLTRARADPDDVARALEAGLAAGDPLAAQAFRALGEAGLSPDAAALHAALGAATGSMRIRVADALHTLTGDETWSTPIVEELARATHWGDRLDAARLLAGFAPTAELVAALRAAACEPDYLVRYHSINTLLAYAGSRADAGDSPSRLAAIGGDDPTAWQSAADKVTKRIRLQ